MRQRVGIVLEGVRVEVLSEQLGVGVSYEPLVAGIQQRRGEVGRQAEAMIHLTKQEDAGIGRDARVRLTQLDGLVKRGLEEPSVCITHSVALPFRRLRSFTYRYLRGGTGLRSTRNALSFE